jgi:hypothetical protein
VATFTQRIKERWYPQHPTNQPVKPEALNNHLRLLTDGIADSHIALQSLMAKITTGTAPITVAAASTATVVVNLSSAMPNVNYVVNATVEGASLQVVNVLRSKGTVTVTVQNLDGANPHTGTVMVWAYNQQT